MKLVPRSALLILLIAGFVVSYTVLSGRTIARSLQPPFDHSEILKNWAAKPKKKFNCGAVPKAVLSVEIESKYKKGTGSTEIDQDKLEKYNKFKARIVSFTGRLISMSNDYIKTSPSDDRIAACVVAWMSDWAAVNALELPAGRPGEAVRAQSLAEISMAYLQVADSAHVTSAERAIILAWIRRLADRVHSDFTTFGDLPSRHNNHVYWAAWSVMSAAIVLDDPKLFDWAVDTARSGIAAITADGFLPLELQRKQRALGYHSYAAEALVLLATTAKANGVDLWTENNSGLTRLVLTVVKGVVDSSAFKTATGYEQEDPTDGNTRKLSWLFIYSKFNKSDDVLRLVGTMKSLASSSAGGDILLLYGTSEDKRNK